MADATDHRYDRQIALPQISAAGQARLGAAHVLLIGCGALGTVSAEQLVRAGIGRLSIIDRDLVEPSNLQRQTLFDEADARAQTPKAVAAAGRLGAINSTVRVEAIVADFESSRAERLLGTDPPVDLVLDGTDNAQTRYLINDLCVKQGLPWVYGACVGTEGRVMAIRPGSGPCLRCVFPTAPGAGELATCATAGVLAPAAAIVASLQVVAAIRLLLGTASMPGLVSFDAWSGRFHQTPLDDARDPQCPACGQHRFDFLSQSSQTSATLCGRNAVQFRAPAEQVPQMDLLQDRLVAAGVVTRSPYLLRFVPHDDPEMSITLFVDGRAIVHGRGNIAAARSALHRYFGG